MVVFYLCALWNIHVFPDAMLMCPMMLKHLICLNFVSAHEVLPVACPWSIIFMLFCTLIGLLVLCIPFGRYGIMLICGLLVPPEVYMHEEFMLAYFAAKKGGEKWYCCMPECYDCYHVLHLFCNYVMLCVDVGTHVATS